MGLLYLLLLLFIELKFKFFMIYFNSLSVPLKIVPRATPGTLAVGCRRMI
jgi:hypothetical protein